MSTAEQNGTVFESSETAGSSVSSKRASHSSNSGVPVAAATHYDVLIIDDLASRNIKLDMWQHNNDR